MQASVTINGVTRSEIKSGLVIFIGFEDTDTTVDVKWLSKKIVNLRIFDDENGVPRFDIPHQVLDPGRRDRVQCRAGLIHEDHVRLDGERAGDAQPLRLPTGQAQARRLQAVLHLVPQRGLPQRVLDDLVQLARVALAVDARPVGDVVVDLLR